uniref:Transducin/WD40 repeat-like superfamily protein n=1 Tax=Kalanchoe fedtschenkoi TaxID=63787 RepID=A0A7N0RDE7_KALFE
MANSFRRLRGHKDTATCCVASHEKPGLVVTAGEDGCVCLFDMRCKEVIYTMEVGENPISSLCFKPGMEIKSFDISMLTSWKAVKTFACNAEEINQVACNSKASFLGATDDGGEVKIVDIRQNSIFKTLRNVHTSICSTVQFIPWRPYEVITGGLDSKLVLWDFSKGRPLKVVDYGMSQVGNSNAPGQCLNPAFVHSVAVPEVDMLDKTGKMCVVGRGDGVVDVMAIEPEPAPAKTKTSGKKSQVKSGTASTANDSWSRMSIYLDEAVGGHSAAVSCVTISSFGEKGKFIISGGNDKSVKVWNVDCMKTSSSSDILHLNIDLTKKVNWLCTTPCDTDNLVVCDTSKVVKVYSIS